LPAILITLILDLQFLFLNQFLIFISSILAALIASGFFLSIFLLSKGRAMGFGDVKLAVLMGLLLGLQNVLVALFLAFFLGAIIGLILMVRQKKKLKSEIPFGPFLITGTFIALLWGSQLVSCYLHLFLV
jgi:prepilin signal peptidase PulO-like enzyme (type II secretory pathway)